MNIYILVSGILAAFCTIGHFVFGVRWYIQPMLDSSFDVVPKKVLYCVFHYISVFMVFTTAALIGAGVGLDLGPGNQLLIQFIAMNYATFGIVQLVIALTSGVDRAIFKMFQWTIFIPVALFAWLGTCPPAP